MPTEITALDWTFRLLLAAALSGLIGFERETKQHAAGLRTHMLVGLGAAMFTILGAYALGTDDPARVAAGIVAGVGFLGAGAIFREGVTVRGLTTAAGLWTVAAIGMTVGAGLALGAVVATAIAFGILSGLGLFERRARSRRSEGSTTLVEVLLSDLGELGEVVALACALDPEAREAGVEKTGADTFAVTFRVAPSKAPTVIAGVATFSSVVGASEIIST